MTFAQPAYFFLLLLLVPLLVWHVLTHRRATPALRWAQLGHLPSSWRSRLVHLPFVLRMLALVLLIVILARPQSTSPQTQREVEGIDIMIAMDVSVSMLTQDLEPNRIEAAKQVAIEFIAGRENDNIGLTLFGGEAVGLQHGATADVDAIVW